VASTAERDANIIIERQLDERAKALEKAMDADVVTYMGPMFAPADDAMKDAIEGIATKRNSLLCVIETGGGYIDTAARIARIFRHHYPRVDFLVPSYAMSAGTVLVMSGDSIWMDYASSLGPIDPQVSIRGERMVPALGYLEKYERLIKKSAKGKLTTVEVAYLVQNFDPAELYRYEQERELSIALLKEWLVNYKFKDWKKTVSRKKAVTNKMKADRAAQIARMLNKTDHWHSHSRGISMEVLKNDLKLLIDDFGADPKISSAVRSYYHLLRDYSYIRRGHDSFVLHRRGEYVGY
jgi:hypothetical protein